MYPSLKFSFPFHYHELFAPNVKQPQNFSQFFETLSRQIGGDRRVLKILSKFLGQITGNVTTSMIIARIIHSNDEINCLLSLVRNECV